MNIPCSQGSNGLPVGVQIIGRPGDDARTIAVAAWLQQRLQNPANFSPPR